MYRIEFTNSKDKPIFVQVDPWACLYKLEKGECIEFVTDDTLDDPRFTVDEYDDANRILTLDCEEFFVVVDGKRVHWQEYQTNLPQQD
ncbi:hypothetical protein [Rubinisphaera brasiliensis]|uniref:Uncharacterized protein n=1 Tax=Rubinisphaera brasiliensis (strain ATCC 49424 / DSM 5305 / JCM 21570 / IAM 15109 / NBRC 103401 / IFAM 1448) TaxID=756272 RepID=F0SFC1_RUBBR|nr:hypothetical protein [Rubinisphaera brasiliensis]ADY59328.1 hypothetical protein Plabr_1717 [Rubinisphaera brasiliensis DSM 5305]